jgi:hypothetical protein
VGDHVGIPGVVLLDLFALRLLMGVRHICVCIKYILLLLFRPNKLE